MDFASRTHKSPASRSLQIIQIELIHSSHVPFVAPEENLWPERQLARIRPRISSQLACGTIACISGNRWIRTGLVSHIHQHSHTLGNFLARGFSYESLRANLNKEAK